MAVEFQQLWVNQLTHVECMVHCRQRQATGLVLPRQIDKIADLPGAHRMDAIIKHTAHDVLDP